MRPNDLPLLVSLNTLLELRNVTHAAKKLHVTQPALSAQLARLRALFKDPLLVPSESGRGMVATPKALQIAKPLREALRQIEAVGNSPDVFDPATTAASFRVMGDAASLATIGGRLARSILVGGNADMHIQLLTADHDVLESFERDEADVLISPLAIVPEALRSRTLFVERHVGIRRKGRNRTAAPMTSAQYGALDHIAVEGDDRLEQMIAARLGKDESARRVSATVARYDMLPSILQETDLLATVPAGLIQNLDGGLEVLELPFLDSEAIVMAWHKRHDGDDRHSWLRERVLSLVAQPGAPVAQPATVAQIHVSTLPRRHMSALRRHRA